VSAKKDRCTVCRRKKKGGQRGLSLIGGIVTHTALSEGEREVWEQKKIIQLLCVAEDIKHLQKVLKRNRGLSGERTTIENQ